MAQAKDIIVCFLDKIKEAGELSPKGSYRVDTGQTSYFHEAGELIFPNGVLYEWLQGCGSRIDNTTQLKKILAKLMEDGLIVKAEISETTTRLSLSDEEREGNQKKKSQPRTSVKDKIGYFQFYMHGGEKIKIGRDDTRKFKLLKCLCDSSFGVRKTVEAVFEAIVLSKDKKNQKLNSYGFEQEREKLSIIETTIGELQKIPQFQRGRLQFRFDDAKRTMWLE